MEEVILALLVMIRAVESTDGRDPRANGNEYQITSRCVMDVNRIWGTHYKWPDDVRDRDTAEDVVVMYLAFYGMRYFEDYRRIPSAEVLAKIYHCGYAGFRRGDRRGDDYWKKIRAARQRSVRRAK